MPTSSDLLLQLEPFINNEMVIVDDQNVTDIIGAILDTHKQYREEYDKIYQYFVGSTPTETANNIFKYLKKNVKYNIEPENLQTVKSPAAIIATGNAGSDCKNYALFINGVLDSYRRNELQGFDLYFRFASYDPFDNTPQHVFSVMNIDGKEIWIDPVLSFFNQKKQPNYYKDKKIKQMALVALSGIIDPYENYYNNKTMGDPYGNYYNNKTMGDLQSSAIKTATTSAAAASAGGLNPVADIAALVAEIGTIGELFAQWNSTSWESNWNLLKNKTPDEQLAYYIQGVKSGKLDHGFLNQYSELFGNKADMGGNSAGGHSRVKELHYEVAQAYNDLYRQVFPDDPSIGVNLIDLTKTIQPTQTNSLINNILPGGATNTSTGISPIILIGGAALLFIALK